MSRLHDFFQEGLNRGIGARKVLTEMRLAEAVSCQCGHTPMQHLESDLGGNLDSLDSYPCAVMGCNCAGFGEQLQETMP